MNKIRFFTAGESHGKSISAILEGFPAGVEISTNKINAELVRRQQGYGAGARMAIEKDHALLTSGILANISTGAPIQITIPNKDHAKWKGKAIDAYNIPRPGHADISAAIKYQYNDFRQSLERASARETAGRVAVGAICKQFLTLLNIHIYGYVKSIGKINATIPDIPYNEIWNLAEQSQVRSPDKLAAEKMIQEIEKTIQGKNTLGGVIEVIAMGIPPGLGSHVQHDRKLDAILAAAVISIQAMKGVEIGSAFENTTNLGTDVHDAIVVNKGNILRPTNRAGGIEGGISNGMPIILRTAMKPIATTLTPQKTINISTGEETETRYERSDFCPVPRAVPIVEAALAIEITNQILIKLGGDSIKEILPRFHQLPKLALSDLTIDGENRVWWPEDEN
jgi:chorismate synthase